LPNRPSSPQNHPLVSTKSRISDLTLRASGKPLDAAKDYVVAGWASVNENVEGPAIWDVVMSHIQKKRVVAPKEADHVRVIGA